MNSCIYSEEGNVKVGRREGNGWCVRSRGGGGGGGKVLDNYTFAQVVAKIEEAIKAQNNEAMTKYKMLKGARDAVL